MEIPWCSTLLLFPANLILATPLTASVERYKGICSVSPLEFFISIVFLSSGISIDALQGDVKKNGWNEC